MSNEKTTTAPHLEFFADAMKRLHAATEQWAAYEQKGATEAHAMIEESARLAKASIDQALKLSAEWRKMAFENAGKMIGMM